MKMAPACTEKAGKPLIFNKCHRKTSIFRIENLDLSGCQGGLVGGGFVGGGLVDGLVDGGLVDAGLVDGRFV